MNTQWLIFKHYFKRTLKDRLALITQIAVPLGIMAFMIFTSDLDSITEFTEEWGAASQYIILNMSFSFLFFGGAWFLNYLIDDLKNARRFRLGAAPVKQSRFAIGAMMGSFIVSLVQTIVVVGVSLILMPFARIDHLWLWIILGLITATASHALHYIILFFAKTMSQATAIGNVITMGLALIGGAWIMGLHAAIDHPIATFIYEWGTPISLARRAMIYAGTDWSITWMATGVFAGVTALLILIGMILGSVKKA